VISVRAFFEVSPWFVEELIVLPSSFDGSGFCSISAVWYSQSGDVVKEGGKQAGGFFEVSANSGEDGTPLAKGVGGLFESGSIETGAVLNRSLEHQSANQVASDDVHLEFLEDHCRCFAFEKVHSQRDQQLREVAETTIGNRAYSGRHDHSQDRPSALPGRSRRLG